MAVVEVSELVALGVTGLDVVVVVVVVFDVGAMESGE